MSGKVKYPVPEGDVSKLYARFKNDGDDIAIILSEEEQARMDKIVTKIVKKNIQNLLSEYFPKDDLKRVIEQWIAIAYHEESHYYHGNKQFYVIETRNGFRVSNESLLDRQITEYLTSISATKENKDEIKERIILECKKCSHQQNALLSNLGSSWNSNL